MAGEGLEAKVERVLSAAAEIAWAALTRPECLGVWLSAGFESEFRRGGRYRDPAGDAGEYLEIQDPVRVRMSWENPLLGGPSTVELSVQGIGPEETRVRIHHSGIGAEADRVRLLEHWSWAVDSLDMFLKTGEGLPYEPWVDLQKELRRRAAEKSAAEAAAEREAAGVVLHKIPELGTRVLPEAGGADPEPPPPVMPEGSAAERPASAAPPTAGSRGPRKAAKKGEGKRGGPAKKPGAGGAKRRTKKPPKRPGR
ncbi:MAG: SRPBCC domain-containing protein [Candidatus Brocadiae bacterium]|nr:SRPBCC domain-containing protein [Candidatus Brocadiia bacterium]